MFISESTIKFYVDFIKSGYTTKDRLLKFILEREGCSGDDGMVIYNEVMDRLSE